MDERFDTIVIGSGLGGLTCASLLAQLAGQRVLVLERHFTAGGFTHEFHRPGGRRWDVGLHYVGRAHEGGQVWRLFGLLCGRPLSWNRMPEPFERFVYPDLDFGARGDPRRYERDLAALFPQESRALRGYFRDVHAANRWLTGKAALQLLPRPLPSWLGHPLRAWGRRQALVTTRDVLDARFSDPRLKALLASQWGDHGLPPSQSAFLAHALIVEHYLRGGYYPEGGAGRIAEHVRALLVSRDGDLRVNHRVESILFDGPSDAARACGVRVERGTGRHKETVELRARQIVSAAGADTTYRQLLPKERVPASILDDLARLPRGTAHVTLYLGLRDDPRSLGFRGENHWIFTGYDHDAAAAQSDATLRGAPPFAYLSFPSLKDGSASAHTAELLTMVRYDGFARWRDQPWRRRDAEYEALKKTISDGLLALVERHHPGFTALVDFAELSTPLTTEAFTGHTEGRIYGLPATPERYALPWLGVDTPHPGLYLTGADVLAHGIVGAMMGGVLTASRLLGGVSGFRRVLGAAAAVGR